ncbi:MAG: hypothetical protein ED559_06030 [Phycisphaera sp.]|nr:MAG: hypothetical protein ED559_06030 [Phycisphaera sp.]
MQRVAPSFSARSSGRHTNLLFADGSVNRYASAL